LHLKRGNRKTGILFMTIACIVCLLTLSCAAQTQYVIKVDALVTMDESGIRGNARVPQNGGLVIYLLPSIQLDENSAGPDERSREGIQIISPIPAPPGPVRLTVRIDGRLTIVNESTVVIPGSEVTGYIAESEDALYPDGIEAGRKEYHAVGPGEEQVLEFGFFVDQDTPAYPIVSRGLFRVGIKIWIYPPQIGDASISYVLEALTVEVSGYPFGFIE